MSPRFHKTAVPAARSSMPLLRWRRRVILGVLVLTMVSGPTALLLTAAASRTAPTASSGVSSQATALAQVAATDFLAGRNSTVPTAQDVSAQWAPEQAVAPNGDVKATKKAAPYRLTFAGVRTSMLGDAADQRVDLVSFLAVNDTHSLTVTVPMRVDDTLNSPVLAAAPSVEPAAKQSPDTADPADLSNYSGGESGDSLEPAVVDSINRWAKAFASEGKASDELRAITGDQDPKRSYDGLSGWAGEVTSIGSAVPVGEDSSTRGFVVRVGLALTPPAANGPTLNTAYDVYVLTDGTQAQPPVVAWGVAGSFTELIPYINAQRS